MIPVRSLWGRYNLPRYIYIYIPGSSWSWKFPHQKQNRSILPNSREKELLNAYFHSRTLFLTPERFRTVLNAFLTLFERLLNAFFHSRTSEGSGTAETSLVFFFPHQPPKSIFFGFGVKKSSIWKLQVYIYIYISNMCQESGCSNNIKHPTISWYWINSQTLEVKTRHPWIYGCPSPYIWVCLK